MAGQSFLVWTIVALVLAGCAAPANETIPDGAAGHDDASAPADGNDDASDESATDKPDETGAPLPATGTLRVHYVNVGQGDGTIWQLPDGSVIVYDCGPAAGSPESNPMNQRLRSIGVMPDAHIHALIASHGHLDHIGGCEEILADYYIDHLYDTWYEGSDAPNSYEQFRDQVRAEGGIIHNLVDDPALPGDDQFVQWDNVLLPPAANATGAAAQIIWPRTFEGDSWDEIAESSIVVRLIFGSVAYCFQGDIETEQESVLASYSQDLDCEVYLVGHHGSRYASSSAWLAKMDPEYAVASFGDNSYGHPTAEALCRIQGAGAAVYGTQRLGLVTVETNGGTVTVTPAAPETVDYCIAGADYWTGSPDPAPTEQPPEEQPTQPHAAPAGPLTVTASASDPDPCQYTTVTISIHVQDSTGAPVNAASVDTTWHYKSNTPTESATTNAQGDASVSRSISSATAGYTVNVEVHATASSVSGSTATSFTPVDC